MFDSHCHLTDDRFAGDVDATLERAWQAGLLGLVTIASDADDAERAHAIAITDERVHSTAGIHPHVAATADARHLARVRELLDLPRVVAIGETGLDYHYDNSPRDAQRRSFGWHLETAGELARPIIVHSRSADDDTIAMIRAHEGVLGVLHCFSAANSVFDGALEAGWYISFAGMITFKNYDRPDLVAATPADRLLLETDSPYLAPVPHRGKRNEPAFVVETGRAAAALRAETPEQTAALVTLNARRFYRLDG